MLAHLYRACVCRRRCARAGKTQETLGALFIWDKQNLCIEYRTADQARVQIRGISNTSILANESFGFHNPSETNRAHYFGATALANQMLM